MTKLNFSKRHLPIPVMLIVFFLIFYFAYSDIKQRTINEFNNEQFILAQTASTPVAWHSCRAMPLNVKFGWHSWCSGVKPGPKNAIARR